MNEPDLNLPAIAQARIAAALDACEGLNTDELEALGAGSFVQLRSVLQRLAEKVARAAAIADSDTTITRDDWRELHDLQREAAAVLSHPRMSRNPGELPS